ncbi:MAG: nuclear transport factor 2 family protein [Microscillaceae bacterium]|nr:nuclear transport factor 2 family protein [Microscillaceae bacterium]
MSTAQIAERLVQLCREGKDAQAQQELYADNVRSVEANGQVFEGLAALGPKGEQFYQMFEPHSNEVSEPIVSGEFFCVSMKMEVTDKSSGKRFPIEELCVYQVKEGKVVLEQFFYNTEEM